MPLDGTAYEYVLHLKMLGSLPVQGGTGGLLQANKLIMLQNLASAKTLLCLAGSHTATNNHSHGKTGTFLALLGDRGDQQRATGDWCRLEHTWEEKATGVLQWATLIGAQQRRSCCTC